jgi:tetratricopeptide (TPR) repeat protein
MVVLVGALVIARLKRAPLLWIGLLIFFLAPLPVLGLAPFEFQQYSTVADHYLYVGMVGPAIVLAVIPSWIKPAQFQSAAMAVGAVLAILGITTFLQAVYWQDTLSLFDHNLVVNPDSFAAHRVMGFQLARQVEKGEGDPKELEKKLDEAVRHDEEALKHSPDDPMTQVNLGNLLLHVGRPQQAIEHYRVAAAAYGKDAQFHNNFGTALAQVDRLDEAYKEFHVALQIDPNFADADANVGRVMALQGKFRLAVAHFERALALDPDQPRVRASLAQTLAMMAATRQAATRASTRAATVPATTPAEPLHPAP